MGTQPPSPKRGRSPSLQFSAHVYCGQTAGWIKMALGMVVGLGPGHIVLDGDLVPLPQKEGKAPNFGPFLLCSNGWMHQDATWYGGRPHPRRLCVRSGPSPHSPEGAQAPVFGLCLMWPKAGWMKTPLGTEADLGRGHIVLHRDPAPPRKGHSSPPLFGLCLLWLRSPISATGELLCDFSGMQILSLL